MFANGRLDVFNANRYHSPDGAAHSISGYATIPNPKVAAKLLVHLDGVPVAAPCVLAFCLLEEKLFFII